MKKFLATVVTVSFFALSAHAQYYRHPSNQGCTRLDCGYYQNQGYTQRTNQQKIKTTQRPTTQTRKRVKKKNSSTYRIGNPLYHPEVNQVLLTLGGTYGYVPREEMIDQDKESAWFLEPSAEIGLTDSLSVFVKGSYGQAEMKSGYFKGEKVNMYDAEIGLRYLLASVDGFDFNVKAGLFYEKLRDKKTKARDKETARSTGTTVALQVGKKIQSVTPYFEVGFKSDLWSQRGCSEGTNTYINPGIYVELTRHLGLDLNYTSITHGDAEYNARFDVYAANNVMVSLGGFLTHPETDQDTYGAKASLKVAF